MSFIEENNPSISNFSSAFVNITDLVTRDHQMILEINHNLYWLRLSVIFLAIFLFLFVSVFVAAFF